jgi:hypothetical protein
MSVEAAQVRSELWRHITRRYTRRAHLGLDEYLDANDAFRDSEPEFVHFLEAHRRMLNEILADDSVCEQLARDIADETLDFTWSWNQYIALHAAAREVLLAVYRTLLRDSRIALRGDEDMESALRHVLHAHHDRLRLFFAALVAEEDGSGRRREYLLRRVPCEEYSAETQCTVLHLDVSTLAEPVLDLGCGSRGTLVRALRARRIDALGVDRNAPREAGFLRADWQDAPLAAGRWGTIVAHQSLSLHLLHHHNSGSARAKDLAALYLRVLRALRPAGRWHYAPAVREFEDVLLQRGDVRIQRYPIGVGEFEAVVVEGSEWENHRLHRLHAD